MKVGLNLSGLRPESYGGAHTYATQLAAGLGASSLDLYAFISSDPSPDLIDLETRGLVRIRRLRTGAYSELRRVLTEARSVGDMASALELDILHSIGAYGVPVPVGITQVVTIFDLLDRAYPRYFTWGQRLKRRAALHFGDRFVARYLAISEFTKSEYVARAGIDESRICVASLGGYPIVTDSRDQPANADSGVRLPNRYALYPASLSPHKNHRLLLLVWRKLVDETSEPLHLVLTGHNTDRYELLELVTRLGLDDYVHVLGLVPSSTLKVVMRQSTCVVFPSEYEGFGLPLVEAMSMGIPIVSSRSSSIPEVVGEAGLLVAEPTVEAYAHAVSTVAGSAPLRSKLSMMGLERSLMFSWERTVQQTIQAYKDALRQ